MERLSQELRKEFVELIQELEKTLEDKGMNILDKLPINSKEKTFSGSTNHDFNIFMNVCESLGQSQRELILLKYAMHDKQTINIEGNTLEFDNVKDWMETVNKQCHYVRTQITGGIWLEEETK